MARHNTKSHLTGFIILVLSLVLTTSPAVMAHGNEDGMSKEKLHVLINEAEFVFRGQVTAVNYTLAESANGGSLMPYTLVTYAVEDVYKGDDELTEITLRFLGGAIIEADGKMAGHLKVALFPTFDIDDHDVLFVRGNTQSICPLVDCAAGRLRLIDNGVYTEGGAELMQDEEGEIHEGTILDLKEFNTHEVQGKTFSIVSKEPSPIRINKNVSRHDIFSLAGASLPTRQIEGALDSSNTSKALDQTDLEELLDTLAAHRTSRDHTDISSLTSASPDDSIFGFAPEFVGAL